MSLVDDRNSARVSTGMSCKAAGAAFLEGMCCSAARCLAELLRGMDVVVRL